MTPTDRTTHRAGLSAEARHLAELDRLARVVAAAKARRDEAAEEWRALTLEGGR